MLYILLNLDIIYDIIYAIMPLTTARIRRAQRLQFRKKGRLTIHNKIRHKRFRFSAAFSVDVET